MIERDFQKRTGYEGNFKPLLVEVCSAYDLGMYISHKVLTSGYEDFNLVLETEKGRFFTKIFADFRDLDNCKRYLKIISEVLKAGVSHPKLFSYQDKYLFQKAVEGKDIRLCVMEFVEGESFYESKSLPLKEEIRDLVKQAAKINKIQLKPSFIYDSWSITSFPKEFEKVSNYLEKVDLDLIKPLLEEFQNTNVEELPHCLVHGDIIKTNVLTNKAGKIFIVDFSVS